MAEYIISSGESSDGIILENDSLTVLDGGIATTATVNSGSQINVLSGGTANGTTVKYGEDGTERLAALSGMGTFATFTSRKIFEESGKGILAAL